MIQSLDFVNVLCVQLLDIYNFFCFFIWKLEHCSRYTRMRRRPTQRLSANCSIEQTGKWKLVTEKKTKKIRSGGEERKKILGCAHKREKKIDSD